MIPDYLDGSRKTTHDAYIHMGIMSSCQEYKENKLYSNWDLLPDTHKRYKDFYIKFLGEHRNASMMSILALYKNNPINYVLSNPLTECFKKTKANLTKYSLPEKFNAYIEFDNVRDFAGFDIAGCFVNIVNDLIFVAYFSHKQNGKKIPAVRYNVHAVCTTDCVDLDDACKEDLEFSRVIINTILYINSKGASLVNEQNQFSTKRSKRDFEQKQFTPKNWIHVGKDFFTKHLPRGPLTCGAFNVRGHWRWQPCGPGRANHELIYIDPFIKGDGK